MSLRMGVGATDQAVSSLSNILATLAVARITSPSAFGGFALAYTGYLVVLGCVRGLTGEAFVVLARDRDDIGTALSAAAIVGVFSSVMFIVAGLAVGSPVRGPSIIIGLFLPALLVQDAGRLCAIGLKVPRHALVSDGLWCAVFVLAYAGELIFDVRNVNVVTITWGAAGCVALWAMVRGLHVSGGYSFARGWRWLRETVNVGGWLGGEYLLINGIRQINLSLIAAYIGLTAVAGIRGGQAVLGPVTTLQYALLVVISPEIVRSRVNRRRQRMIAVYATSLLLVLDAIYGLALWSLPTTVGQALLGAVWNTTHRLLLPQMAIVLAVGAILGGEALLRGNLQVRAAMFVRVVAVVGSLCGVVVGCLSGNVLLALWLQAAAGALVIVPYWVLGWRSTRAA